MAFRMLLSLLMITLSAAPIRRYYDVSDEGRHRREPTTTIFMSQNRMTDANFGPNLGTLTESLKWNAPKKMAAPRRKQARRGEPSLKTLPVTFLLLSGDISPNPGPRKPKYPCGLCKYAVGATQRAIQCDSCNFWIHFKCIQGMTVQTYHALGDSDEAWYCNLCATEMDLNNVFDFSDSFFSEKSTHEDDWLYFTDSFFESNHENDTDINNEDNVNIDNSVNLSTDSDESDESQDTVISKLKDVKSKHSKNTIVAYLNINSYTYKAGEIISLLNRNFVDIMCIAESKLDETFPSQQFQADDYILYRKDGPTANSGGLLIYTSSRLSSRRRTDLETRGHECIVIEIISNRKKVLFYFCYRSPSVNINPYLQKLSASIDAAILETDNVSVIGTLNQNMLMRTQCKELCDFTDVYNMYNLIREPTCYKSSTNNSLVDVLLTTQKNFYKTSGVVQNGYSDVHHMIYGVMKTVNLNKPAKTITYRSYKTFDEENSIKTWNRHHSK